MLNTFRNIFQFFFRHPRDWYIPTAKYPPEKAWTKLGGDFVVLHIAQATNLRRLR